MTLPFSDSDSDHERSTHDDFLSKHQNKVSPVSLSKYGGVWQTDATNETLDTLFEKESETGSEQKNRSSGNDIIDNKENAICMNESSRKDCGTLHKNGGKSCHPKMRAKFMFRSGDFENVDWGSCNDWSSSDNESMRGISNKELSQDIFGLSVGDYENPAKRRRLSTFSLDMSSTASESTIPAIEDLESPTNNDHALSIDIHSLKESSSLSIDSPSMPEYEYSRPNSCPYLESSFKPRPCSPMLDETPSMPVLTNETLIASDESVSLPTKAMATESIESQNHVTDDVKTRDNVFVTEVTLENLTVIIQECGRTKGFFKWES